MPGRLKRAVSRGFLNLLGPRIDASPAEGGLGAHPLKAAAPPWGRVLPPDPTLRDIALTADPDHAASRLRAIPAGAEPADDVAVVSCRLLHLSTAHARLNLPGDLASRVAGMARADAAWLFRQQALPHGDPDLALLHAALLTAGLAWPALEDARAFRSAGISGLRHSLGDATGEDGPGGAEPAALARAAWAVCIARAWLDAGRASLPRDADAALLRACTALWRIGGDSGTLPSPVTEVEPLLPLCETPLSHTLHDLMVTWGLHDGPPASQGSAAATLLTRITPAGAPAPMAGPDWRMWAYRASGVAVAHRTIRKMPARAWISASAQRFSLDLDGETVLDAPMPAGTLDVARVDGNQATLKLSHGPHTRDLRLRQARLQVSDDGLSEVTWTLPPWPREATDKGFHARAPNGAQLVVKVDPAWRWTFQGDTLIGTGEPQPIKYAFELR